VTTRQHESAPLESRQGISASADDWIRKFIKLFEEHLADAGCDLPPNVSNAELRVAAVRAILATLIDTGMEPESAMELLGQAAAPQTSGRIAWSDSMNQRRFGLIDKEIQGTLTPAERVELAGLTGIMREQVETEMNLPMMGARALHRKLLQLGPTGAAD
jgi:hypothetical protein